MVRPLPEHLHLQLVVMVMRGSNLQPQVFRGDRVQGRFSVRQRGSDSEVRGGR